MALKLGHMNSTGSNPLRVRTTSGWVEGILCSEQVGAHPALVRSWRGIPFGAPNHGANRFGAPQPAPEWEGTLDCSEYGAAAVQPTYSLTEKLLGSEDCLNLDIVRPNTDETLPVVVYFHGGSFIMGSSHMLMLRGLEFAAAMNAVYVSVNFRLGALGYIDVTSLAGGAGEATANRATAKPATANPAMRDQILALEWVQENIARFGGDPDSVTAMGESAGGGSVLTLMASPCAQGLFHRAIAQSPPVGTVHSRAQSAAWAKALVRRLGLSPDATVADLRELDATDIVRAGQSTLWRSGALFNLNSCYAPTIDGEVLPEHPIAVFERGRQADVPLMIGTNADEASFGKFIYQRRTHRMRAGLRMLTTTDEDNARQVMEAYGPAITRSNFAQLIADAVFWAPAVRVAEAHAKKYPTWMYRFDFAPKAMRVLGLGAMHSAELSAVFGTPHAARAAKLTNLGDTDALHELSVRMQAFWRLFIHHGTPESKAAPETAWPAYTAPERATYVFSARDHVENDPKKRQREAWATYDMEGWAAGRPQLFEDVDMVAGPSSSGVEATSSDTKRGESRK